MWYKQTNYIHAEKLDWLTFELEKRILKKAYRFMCFNSSGAYNKLVKVIISWL